MISDASVAARGCDAWREGRFEGVDAVPALPFASCYVYSPSGGGAAAARSRRLCALLKSADAQILVRCAARVRGEADARPPLAELLGAASLLVPVPGSAPPARAMPWAAAGLADALFRAGLGGGVWRGLERVRGVRKSATAPPGARPTVAEHYASLVVAAGCAPRALACEDIVLIDDIVTKGRTLLGAAWRLHEAMPRARIRAFALLRTMGFASGIGRLLEPCLGEIRLRGGDARRRP